jgi:hypothetical protein
MMKSLFVFVCLIANSAWAHEIDLGTHQGIKIKLSYDTLRTSSNQVAAGNIKVSLATYGLPNLTDILPLMGFFIQETEESYKKDKDTFFTVSKVICSNSDNCDLIWSENDLLGFDKASGNRRTHYLVINFRDRISSLIPFALK